MLSCLGRSEGQLTDAILIQSRHKSLSRGDQQLQQFVGADTKSIIKARTSLKILTHNNCLVVHLETDVPLCRCCYFCCKPAHIKLCTMESVLQTVVRSVSSGLALAFDVVCKEPQMR